MLIKPLRPYEPLLIFDAMLQYIFYSCEIKDEILFHFISTDFQNF